MKTQFEQTNAESQLTNQPDAPTQDMLSDLSLTKLQTEQIKGGPVFAYSESFIGGVTVAAGDVTGAAQSSTSRHSGGANFLFADGSVRF